MWYLGEIVTDLDGSLAVQIRADHLKQMGWDEQTLLEWMIEEETNERESKTSEGR